MKFRLRYVYIVGLFVGHYVDAPLVQILALFLYSVAILWEDFRGAELRRLDISTTFTVMVCLTSFAHFAALSPWIDTGNSWATYLVPQYLEDGLFIFGVGSFLIMESLRRSIKGKTYYAIDYNNDKIFTYTFVVGVVILVADHFKFIPPLGSISSFIALMVNGSVFLMAYVAHATGFQNRIYIVAFYAAGLSLYAIQFAYLRMEIVLPWLAYFMGEILARRKLFSLHFVSKVIFIGGLIVYPVIFNYLGKNRSSLAGRQEKLEIVLQEGTKIGETDDGETLLGRLNVLGQMSNIVNLTEKKGLYQGYTLSYFAFVFIPRVFWPEKPTLDAGQWFAVEIGRSYYKKSGKANSSINMTVPGEMYLNFGWPGLIIGCVLFGIFISKIWSWVNGEDIFSWTFRFYLLFLGMFSLGSDLMVIPQLIAYILIYKTILFIKSTIFHA